MPNSLSRVPSGAENCALTEWAKIGQLSKSDRIVAMHEKRDPLGPAYFRGIEASCVFGFLSRDREPGALIYFWCDDLAVCSYKSLSSKSHIRNLIEFGLLLAPNIAKRPSLGPIKAMYEGQIKGMFSTDVDFLDDKHLYWSKYDELTFCSLFKVADTASGFSTASVMECLDFHCDYFRVKSPVWQCVPISYLFGRVPDSAELVTKLLVEPKCFDPYSPLPDGWFLWPWQKSFDLGDGDSVRYRPIDTTSLIFDLRKSTIALEQMRDEEASFFSDFIKQTIATVKQVIFENGGFFDKETGDGVVGHFVDFTISDVALPSASARAFQAAQEIVSKVRPLCEKFQERLNMGVGGLGAAVGVHSGKAVWICEENVINAVGHSTILASRLCAESASNGIFVSNLEYLQLQKDIPREKLAGFEKRKYAGKEFNGEANLFGYILNI